jgi:hypothetical protein
MRVNVGPEPVLLVAAVAVLVLLLVAFQWDGLSGENFGIIAAVIIVLATVATALAVRPIGPPLFAGFAALLVVLVYAYGFNAGPRDNAIHVSEFMILLALLVRVQTAPWAITPQQPVT